MPKPEHNRVPPLISLKKIFEGTSEFTGKPFFRNLVREMGEVLDVHGVWVTEYKEKEYRLNSLAFWLNGAFVEKYEYDIKGTPCEPVIGSDHICHVPENVIDLYPDDPDLPPLGAVSYMGIALKDTDGRILGHLALLDTKPMEELPEVFFIFNLFATRAAAELRRIQYEKRLQDNEQKIHRLLNGTMDAIIELREDLSITQANEAALKTFQVERADFTGRFIQEFLQQAGVQKLQDAIPFLQQTRHGPAALWIQGYLPCKNARGEPFPADATLSTYAFDGQTYYALYIRDVHDRIKKEQEIRKLTVETVLLQERVDALQMGDIIGESEAMILVQNQIGLVAPTDSTVLILGETGTGKELIAREIHRKSRRSEKPYITLNCAALPAELIESELFGHVKGAFTGAAGAREGRFALADGGTIFLDEIGELPLALQAKLLRVIQEGEFEPLGSSFTRKTDVRIIAATHRNLKQEAADRHFREDLYYRLNVFPIKAPPLRERGRDILLLAEAFLGKYARRYGRKITPPGADDQQKLLAYPWPGNVRELQNIMERAVITSRDGQLHFALSPGMDHDPIRASPNADRVLTDLEIQEMEKKNLLAALKATGGKVFGKDGAAQLLGIPATTFTSRLKKFGIK